MKYRGTYSSIFSLPGGGPQGSLLGLFLFLVLIDDLGFCGQMNNVGDLITQKKKVFEINGMHLKYVDDLALVEAVNLTNQLTLVSPENRPLPDTYRARTGHTLRVESSKVYEQLKNTVSYAENNKMKINLSKTKLILFNPCVSKDFMPEMVIENTRFELVEQIKLLGVVISSDLSWSANTQYITDRCNSKIWMLRRLKRLGASQEDLLDVYSKQIRSVTEFAVPVWNSSLTGNDIASLERIQKIALHVILGEQYQSYSAALKTTGLIKLSERRKKICLKFAKRALNNTKFSKWFKPNPRAQKRLKQQKLCPVIARTERFEKSPISYLTKLLNNQ